MAQRVSAKLSDNQRVIQTILLEYGAACRMRDVDAPVSVAFSVGSTLSIVLLDDGVSRCQRRPGRGRQITQATWMAYGVTGLHR